MNALAQAETAVPLLAGLAWACIQDLRERRISNAANFSLSVCGIGAACIVGGAGSALLALIGAALGLGLGGAAYRLRWLGGGDAKMLAAVGAWTGPAMLVLAALFTALAGGVLAIIVLLAAGKERRAMRAPKETRPRSLQVPYGIAIATGTIAALFLALEPARRPTW
jgi:prepilin peptidase CpaA